MFATSLDVRHEHEDDIHTGSTVSTPTKLVKKNDACQETSATSIFRWKVSDTGGFRELGENVIQVAEPTTLYGACNGVKVTCVDASGQRTRHVVKNYKRI